MRGLLWDCLFVGGATAICAGIYFIHWPSAIITAGGFMLALAVMGARTETDDPEPEPDQAPVHQEDESPWDS